MEFKKHHRTLVAIGSMACKLHITADYYFWSEEDLIILKENYNQKDGLAICMKLLPGKTKTEIQNRARYYGYKEESFWTADKINIVKQFYPIEGADCYKRISGATRSTVFHIAHRLKIVSNRYWSEQEIDILKNNINLTTKELMTLLPDRTKSQIQGKLHSLGLDKIKKVNRLVYCIELDMVYTTIKEAAIALNINIAVLRNCLAGQKKSCGGYHWKYIEE